jgi:hypothetical protein
MLETGVDLETHPAMVEVNNTRISITVMNLAELMIPSFTTGSVIETPGKRKMLS